MKEITFSPIIYIIFSYNIIDFLLLRNHCSSRNVWLGQGQGIIWLPMGLVKTDYLCFYHIILYYHLSAWTSAYCCVHLRLNHSRRSCLPLDTPHGSDLNLCLLSMSRLPDVLPSQQDSFLQLLLSSSPGVCHSSGSWHSLKIWAFSGLASLTAQSPHPITRVSPYDSISSYFNYP